MRTKYALNDKRITNLKLTLQTLNESVLDGRKRDALSLVPCVLADVQRLLDEIEAQQLEQREVA